jgi:cytochrome c-type biogenesis protein CcmH/NrfG
VTPEQFAELLAELRTMKLVLVGASVLVAASAALAALRTYQYVKHHVVKGLDDLFQREALDLLERGQLELLVSRCRERLRERPNHVYAHWFLGRAYYLQERWDEALQAFEAAKRISPEWAESVEAYIDDIRMKGGSH